MKLGTMVQVIWTDANYERDQSVHRDAVRVETPTVCTYGVLIRLTRKRVVLSSEVLHYKAENNYRTTTAIPRRMVKRIVRLKQTRS